MLKPNPNAMVFRGGAFGRCFDHAGGTLTNGLMPYKKGLERVSFSFYPPAMGGYSKKESIHKAGGSVLPDTKLPKVLILDISASRTV